MKTIEYTLRVKVEASITLYRNEDEETPTHEEMISYVTNEMDQSGGMHAGPACFYACDFVGDGPIEFIVVLDDGTPIA